MGSGLQPQQQTLLGHPVGLYVLFFAEMWERFSYYGMRALLVFYMLKGFLRMEDERAYAVYGAYTALVYATPFLGGLLADRLLGARRAVVWGGLLMAAGHGLMTVERAWAFYGALALLVCGIQLIYAFYLVQLPDWSSVWVTMIATSLVAAASILKPQRRGGPSSLRANDANVRALLSRMTLEEKIGQMIQANSASLKDPSDVEKLFLGSILSGGSSDPKNGNSLIDWTDHYDSLQSRTQNTRLRIPILYGIDAVHGHSNVLGAVIFPHNIGLGATRFETVRKFVFPYAKAGLLGAAILGLGRAVGETIAVTMLIGNAVGIAEIPDGIYAPSQTLSSVIANEFNEAVTQIHISALIGLAAVLFVITMAINVGAQLLVRRMAKVAPGVKE